MSDCHIDNYVVAGPGGESWLHRAVVIHTSTGRVLYTTWPYGRHQSAIARARRWLCEEYQRIERPGLFGDMGGNRP